MKKIDLSNVTEAGESRRLPAGGYVCKFTKVTDDPEKEMLRIEYDIAEGEFKNYYKDLEARANFWGGHYIRSYKPKAMPFFKRMCSAVSKSNGNYVFDGGQINSDESTLVGKLVGIVFQEEEYVANDGSVKNRLIVDTEKSVDDIRSGNFKVKGIKYLPDEDDQPRTSSDSFVNLPEDTDDDELPFI